MAAPTLIKTLTLSLDDTGGVTPVTVECQLSNAQLTDESSAEEVTTFCGTYPVSVTSTYTLTLGGFQDYGDADSVADMLHTAYINEAALDFVLTVGTVTRSGKCAPTADVPFGGEAGAPLEFEVELAVTEGPTDGVAA